MSTAHARSAAGLAAACLALAGCVSMPPPGTLEPLDSARPVAVSDPRVTSLAEGLEATFRDRRSLVASARVSLTAPDLRFSRPQRVALQQPASLRVEILGLFNQVAAILATDGVRYQLYQPGSDGIEEGRVDARLLWDVARVDLEPEEAVGLLLGVPLAPGSHLEAARRLEDGRLLLAFRQPDDGSRRIFEFDPSAHLARVRKRSASDALVWEAVYTDYRPVGSRSFAYQVDIDFPRLEANADFRFSAAELNRELPASAFVLRPDS